MSSRQSQKDARTFYKDFQVRKSPHPQIVVQPDEDVPIAENFMMQSAVRVEEASSLIGIKPQRNRSVNKQN